MKVLTRYNPDGDREMNRRQAERLARLSDWLAPRTTKYLFELIVPPEAEQLAAVDADPERLRDRAAAGARRTGHRRAAGGRGRAGRLEGRGPQRRRGCRRVADAAGQEAATVGCVVLGAGADDATVAHWLRQAAGVEGSSASRSGGRSSGRRCAAGWRAAPLARAPWRDSGEVPRHGRTLPGAASGLKNRSAHTRSRRVCGPRGNVSRGGSRRRGAIARPVEEEVGISMAEPVLEARNIVKSFGRVQALRGASFTRVPAGGRRADRRQRRGEEHARQDPHGGASARQRRDPLRGQTGVDQHAA